MKKWLSVPLYGVVLFNVLVAGVAFLKDILLAMYLGTSIHSDALSLAYFIPDAIGNNLMAAAIGVASIPVFSKLYVQQSRQRLAGFIRQTVYYYVGFTCILLFIMYLFSHSMVNWLAGGEGELGHLTHSLLLILLPTVLFYPLLSIGSAAQQTLNRFNIPAAAPLFINGLFLMGAGISFLLALPQRTGSLVIAFSIMGGVILAVCLVWGFLPLKQTKTKSEQKPSYADHKEMFKVFIPYLVILLCTQAVYLVERFIAAGLDVVGAVAALSYAFRLAQFPIWVYVAAVTVIILPGMSKHIAANREKDLAETMVKAFKSIIMITLPTTLFFYFMRVPLVSVLFQRGAFDDHSLTLTAGILEGYSLTIFSLAVTAVCLRFFLAAGEIGKPLAIFIFSSLVNIIVDIVLVHQIGVKGLGYGAAIGTAVNAILIFTLIFHKIPLKRMTNFNKLITIGVANLAPILFLLLSQSFWKLIPNGSLFGLGYLISVTAVYILIYTLSLKKLKLIG